MKTFYKVLLFSLLALITLKSNAQSDYKPGYIVTSQGDTLRGLVSFRSGLFADNVCGFKQNEQATITTYTPQDIRSYGFPGDKSYQSKFLSLADSLPAEYVFMEELVRGTMNLYTYKGHFYVKKQDGKTHKLYITNVNYYNDRNELAVRRVNNHVSTLNMLMQDCFAMYNKIADVKLAQRNMVKLVQEYNACAGDAEQTTFKEEKPWVKFQVGVTAGMSHTSLNFAAEDERYLHLEHSNFNSNTNPTFGVVLNINSPRMSEHTSLLLDLQYAKSSYTGDAFYTWFGSDYENEMSMELSALKLGLAGRYDFVGKTFKPFVNAGAFLNFIQQRDFKHTQWVKHTENGTRHERIKDDPEFIGKTQQGFMAGAGTYMHVFGQKFSVEGRYELGLDFHAHNAVNKINKLIDSESRTISFLIGYYF